jgi:heptosyltransferase III
LNTALGNMVWIFHAGALGDHVMIWPLVRALARQGARVTVVAAASHAELCEREIGRSLAGIKTGAVGGAGAENPRFNALWSGRIVSQDDVVAEASAVLSFVADDVSDAGRRWMEGARAMFPSARLICVGKPGSESRSKLWKLASVEEHGGAPIAEQVDGPITLFVGAGGKDKRWPMERWIGLAARLNELHAGRVQMCAGPVEAEKLNTSERAAFENRGVFLGLDGALQLLVERIRASSLFIGSDTGPTHLAAQLGVRTLALFGPTDSGIWGPIGPRTRMIAPERPAPMEWLSVAHVLDGMRRLIADEFIDGRDILSAWPKLPK